MNDPTKGADGVGVPPASEATRQVSDKSVCDVCKRPAHLGRCADASRTAWAPDSVALPDQALRDTAAEINRTAAAFIAGGVMAPPAPNEVQQAKRAGFMFGWKAAAVWANRDDLIADIGSPAYERDCDAACGVAAPEDQPK